MNIRAPHVSWPTLSAEFSDHLSTSRCLTLISIIWVLQKGMVHDLYHSHTSLSLSISHGMVYSSCIWYRCLVNGSNHGALASTSSLYRNGATLGPIRQTIRQTIHLSIHFLNGRVLGVVSTIGSSLSVHFIHMFSTYFQRIFNVFSTDLAQHIWPPPFIIHSSGLVGFANSPTIHP